MRERRAGQHIHCSTCELETLRFTKYSVVRFNCQERTAQEHKEDAKHFVLRKAASCQVLSIIFSMDKPLIVKGSVVSVSRDKALSNRIKHCNGFNI